MVKRLPVFAAIIFILLFSNINLFSQVRIAFLPFQNMDGDMKLNLLCYQLQDSLAKTFLSAELNDKAYRIVPIDSVEQVLAELNVNPANPQYASDMWKAVKLLKAEKVIMGNFNKEADRILINAYIYDVRTKLANPKFQAKDLFKAKDAVMETIPIIFKRLSPAFQMN